MGDGEDSETGPELAKLVSQRRQRPSYTRMISWEMSHAALQQPAKKCRVKKKKCVEAATNIVGSDSNDDNDDDNAANTLDISRDSGSHGDSGSQDSSEYDTANEEFVEESAGADVTDALSVQHSEGELIENILLGTKQMNLDSTNIPTGRRRRLSKKQKRKRKHFRTTYLEELYNLGNLFDPSDEIDSVFSNATEIGGGSDVVRIVPSLVELCLAASTKKTRTGSEKEQPNIGQLPGQLKRQVISRAVERKEQQKLLSYIQNYILPKTMIPNTEKKLVVRTDFFDVRDALVPILKRSVWNTAPMTVSSMKQKSCCSIDSNLKTAPGLYYLHAVDLQPSDLYLGGGLCYHCSEDYRDRSPAHATLVSVFGTMLDLMLPVQLLSNPDSDWKSDTRFKTAMVRLKHALSSRYQPLMDVFFDQALAYVMWARGHTAIATSLFKGLIETQTSVMNKAMYLSEIALMHATFGDALTAVHFYRCAGETALLDQEKHGQQDQSVKEITEQTQILLASVYDRGLLTRDKSEMSCSHWAAARHLPKARKATIIASFDAFLSLAAAHSSAASCWQEGIEKMNALVKDFPYLYYYQSMMYALMGKEEESIRAYKTLKQMSFVVPGTQIVSVIGKKCKTPWQPVFYVTKGRLVPPLRVTWRAQLQHTVLQRHCHMEAQVLSKGLNLRINGRGQICGDLQMLLPPLRAIAFDPYTGSLQLTSVPQATEPWIASFYNIDKVNHSHNAVPTKSLVFSGGNGTTVELLSLSTNDMRLSEEYIKPVFMLYWTDAQGRHAKLDLYAKIKDIMKKDLISKFENEIQKGGKPCSNRVEEDNAMAFHLIELAYKRDLPLTKQTIDDAINKYVHAKKKVKEAKKNAKKQIAEMKEKNLLCMKPVMHLRLICEPYVQGETIIMHVAASNNCGEFLVAVNTRFKEAFSNVEIRRVKLFVEIQNRSSTEFFIVKHSLTLNVYRCPLDLVMSIKLSYVGDRTFTPVIVGSDLYCQNGPFTGVWRMTVFENEETCEPTDDNLVWSLAPYVNELTTVSMEPIIRVLHGLGKKAELLLVTMNQGIGVMVPGVMEFLDMNVEKIVDFPLKLTGDSKVILGNFSASQLLSQEESCTGDVVTNRLMLSVQNSLLVMDIVSNVSHGSHRVTVTHCFTLPGFVKETCFVGKFHILISCSQQNDGDEFYREHLFLYDWQGLLHGVLPCLEQGPRSFLSVYLPGTEGAGPECRPGWRVYMRDGRGGIICIQLDI